MDDMILEEVVPGVFRAGGMGAWHLVVQDDKAIAIDAGLPNQHPKLDRALEELGSPKLEAVLLTHGHADHIGFAEHARTKHGATVYAHEAEAKLLEHVLTGVKPERQPLMYITNKSTRRGLRELLQGGALRPTPVRQWTALSDRQQLDHLPGAPIAHATPGHTPGHTAFELPDHGVVFVGDAMVTHDPYTDGHGPRLMAKGSTWSSEQARASLDRLAELEDHPIALCGHGPVWRDGVAAMARQAMATEQG